MCMLTHIWENSVAKEKKEKMEIHHNMSIGCYDGGLRVISSLCFPNALGGG